MDQDKGSIGGLENPPEATEKLYHASMIMDGAGLLLCLLIGWQMLVLILIYILVSKAYSWHGIRLKKHGVISWLVVVFFQGGYTYLMVNMAAENNFHSTWLNAKNIDCMWIATLLIGGFYPLTQIYQHKEDSERGDITISYRLGIIGTFIFAAWSFMIANVVCFRYFETFYTFRHFIVFDACLLPVTLYFIYWFFITIPDRSNANFKHSMRMTMVSSISMIICFSLIFLMNHT